MGSRWPSFAGTTSTTSKLLKIRILSHPTTTYRGQGLMKFVKKESALKKSNSSTCTVVEYALNHPKFDVATTTISGRYPETRRASNVECAELAYVIAGNGKIVIDNETLLLNSGDVVLIEAGEKYYWEGSMQLLLSCNPAWHAEQHQLVD
jgi:mannose-6-phosphate isomerase-like protein (cupin superfamily)